MDTLKHHPVSLDEIMGAREPVYRYLRPTRALPYEALSRALGARVYVKHENHNPTGSFKIRGGLNLMHHARAHGVGGVITFSTGNHGISVATAAAWAGLAATVVVPEHNNPAKNLRIRQAGAELLESGRTFEEAAKAVDRLCAERGLYYVHPANEPHLINGVGTEFVEIAEEVPDVEVIIVPVGAGSEAAAAVTTLSRLKPDVEIIAVQAERSPAAFRSWKQGSIETAGNSTFAGGFATGTAYELPFGIYRDRLADFVLLSEEEIYDGIALAAHYTRNLVEGAGGSTLAAAFKLRERLEGRTVVLQFSGCNAAADEIRIAYGRSSFDTGGAGIRAS